MARLQVLSAAVLLITVWCGCFSSNVYGASASIERTTIQQQQGRSYPKSCRDASANRTSGIYVIDPQPGFGEPFEVYCDNDYRGGGWSVIQNRYDGSTQFFRGWSDYEHGFGDIRGDHWLGLRRIFEMTNSQRYELVVLLEDKTGVTAMARYDHFLVASPEAKYRLLRLGNYTGNAGDGLKAHLGQRFSTVDADNDSSPPRHCANEFMAGYWYQACWKPTGSNLNGVNLEESPNGMSWTPFKQYEVLKRTRMMIRAV